MLPSKSGSRRGSVTAIGGITSSSSMSSQSNLPSSNVSMGRRKSIGGGNGPPISLLPTPTTFDRRASIAKTSQQQQQGGLTLPPVTTERRLSFKRGGAAALKGLAKQVAQQQLGNTDANGGHGPRNSINFIHNNGMILTSTGIHHQNPAFHLHHQNVTMTTAIGTVSLKKPGAGNGQGAAGPNGQLSQQQRDLQQRDLFRMRYFRFKCKNIEQTIEFYTSFGMRLEFDTDQENVESPPFQHQMLEKAIAAAGSQLSELKTGPGKGNNSKQQGNNNPAVAKNQQSNPGKKPLISTSTKPGQNTIVTGAKGNDRVNNDNEGDANSPSGSGEKVIHTDSSAHNNTAYNTDDASKGLGATVKRVIGLTFAESAVEPPSERVMLIFEEIQEEKEDDDDVPDEAHRDENGDPSRRRNTPPSSDTNAKRNSIAGNDPKSSNTIGNNLDNGTAASRNGNRLASVTQMALAQLTAPKSQIRNTNNNGTTNLNGSMRLKRLQGSSSPNDTSGQSFNETTASHSSNGPKHNYEYLVIYVHFIQRLSKRLQSKGFIVGDIMEIDSVKMFICRDPNGVEIRMMELSDQQLSEINNKKSQWFARLGYYVIPTMYADDATVMYEQLFQIRPAKPTNGNGTDGANGHHPGGRGPLAKSTVLGNSMSSSLNSGTTSQQIDPITGRLIDQATDTITVKNIRKAGPQAILRQAIAKGQGFRIVDMDDFVVGLHHTVFYWLGNDLRSSATSLCFTQVSNADTNRALTYYDPSRSPLIGIGFEVPNLETVMYRLRFETKDELEWEQTRLRMIKFGMVGRFKDGWNGYWLELLCSKAVEAQGPRLRRTKKGGANAKDGRRQSGLDDQIHESDPEEQDSEDTQNLKGSLATLVEKETTKDGETTNKILLLSSSVLKLNEDANEQKVGDNSLKLRSTQNLVSIESQKPKSQSNLIETDTAQGRKSSLPKKRPLEKYEWVIDQNHLKGHTRSISAGAITRRPIQRHPDKKDPAAATFSSDEDLDVSNESVVEDVDTKSLLRKAAVYGSRSVSTQLLNQSEEAKTTNPATKTNHKRRSRPPPKIKTDEEVLRDMMATRQKSVSV